MRTPLTQHSRLSRCERLGQEPELKPTYRTMIDQENYTCGTYLDRYAALFGDWIITGYLLVWHSDKEMGNFYIIYETYSEIITQ